jgi:hypothetical protein
MPNLSPGIFSAHDHAEGEFFSAAAENAGHTSKAAQARQDRQASPTRRVTIRRRKTSCRNRRY